MGGARRTRSRTRASRSPDSSASQPNEIYFTAGATESNNIALNLVEPGEHLITSAIEHKSIVAPAERLEKNGVQVTFLTPDREGFIDPDERRVRRCVRTRGSCRSRPRTARSARCSRSQRLRRVCRERGVLFHSDITQAAGKVPLDMTNVDLAAFSAHKLYGPKGIGGMIVRRGIRIEPVMLGGGQERGVRSGTVNVPARSGWPIGVAAARRGDGRGSDAADGVAQRACGIVSLPRFRMFP